MVERENELSTQLEEAEAFAEKMRAEASTRER